MKELLATSYEASRVVLFDVKAKFWTREVKVCLNDSGVQPNTLNAISGVLKSVGRKKKATKWHKKRVA